MGCPVVKAQAVAQQAHTQRQAYSAIPAASVVVMPVMVMTMVPVAPTGPCRTCGKRPEQHERNTHQFHSFHSRLHSMIGLLFNRWNGPAGLCYGYADITHQCGFWLSHIPKNSQLIHTCRMIRISRADDGGRNRVNRCVSVALIPCQIT